MLCFLFIYFKVLQIQIATPHKPRWKKESVISKWACKRSIYFLQKNIFYTSMKRMIFKETIFLFKALFGVCNPYSFSIFSLFCTIQYARVQLTCNHQKIFNTQRIFMQTTPTPQAAPVITHEYILVVKRTLLFAHTPAWDGLNTSVFTQCADTVAQHKEFILRASAETDPTYKQIIPYMIFTVNGKIFVMQRKKEASEQRLANKMSIGIGGHIRQEDMQTDDIADWGKREFEEEVNYSGKLTFEPLGILNDDSNEVGQVHIGFVYLVHGENEQISIKDEHKSGVLYTLDECEALFETMESWSKVSFQAIKAKLS